MCEREEQQFSGSLLNHVCMQDYEPQQYPITRANAYIDDTNNNTLKCTDHQGTVWTRFVWVVRYFMENGFYVIPENHMAREYVNGVPQGDYDNTFDDAFRTPANGNTWASRWTELFRSIVNHSHRDLYKQRLIVDLLNEPDARKFG